MPYAHSVTPLSDLFDVMAPGNSGVFDAVGRVVIVPGQIEHADGRQAASVNLNFVALRKATAGAPATHRQKDCDQEMVLHAMAPKDGGDCNPSGRPFGSPSAQHPPQHEAKTRRHGEKRDTEQKQGARQNRLRFDARLERQRLAVEPVAQRLLPHEDVAALVILGAGVRVHHIAGQMQAKRHDFIAGPAWVFSPLPTGAPTTWR